jgi:hypothetical protein
LSSFPLTKIRNKTENGKLFPILVFNFQFSVFRLFWAWFLLLLLLGKSYNYTKREGGDFMHVDELVVLAEYSTAVEAEMAKNILACAGICAQIENEYMTTLYPGVIHARLVVPERDYKQAKTLLRLRE